MDKISYFSWYITSKMVAPLHELVYNINYCDQIILDIRLFNSEVGNENSDFGRRIRHAHQ